MKKCTVDGCNMKHFAFGCCRKHHARLKRHGNTDSKYDKSGYSKLGGVKDPRPGARGSLAVNIINDVKNKALKRKKEWKLSHEEAFELIINKCAYCGFLPSWPENRVGIDRVDTSVGYLTYNCVSCCFKCNSSKNDMTFKEFKEHVKKMYYNLFENPKV